MIPTLPITDAGEYITRDGKLAAVEHQGVDGRWYGSIQGCFSSTWWHADGSHNAFINDDIVIFYPTTEIPNWLFGYKKLSMAAIFMYALIRKHALKTGVCRVPDSTLAEKMGLSVRQVQRLCAALRKAGLITQSQHNGQTAERVCLVPEEFQVYVSHGN